MNRFYLILLLTVFAFTVSAQKALLHSGENVQIFNGTDALVSAYNASQAGDIIYLSGHTFTPPANFEKTLTVFGAGHYPGSTQATGKTFINGNVQLRENADNFYLEGVEITGHVILYNNESVNGVTIKRCNLNAGFQVNGDLSNPSTNLAFIGNVMSTTYLGYGIILGNAQAAMVANNILSQDISYSKGNLIQNNVFLRNHHVFVVCENNQIYNNITLNASGYGTFLDCTGNTVKNNLFVPAIINYGTTATVENNYTGVAQTAIFVNQTGYAFDYAHDYHLQSHETYTGTDGTQVGIYGGEFPYKEGAVPSNPHIETGTISSTTTSDGKLNVNIKAVAQDN